MVPQLLVGEIFSGAARAVPRRLAAVLGDEQLSFGELQRRSLVVAAALARSGLRRGDRLGVWAHTSLDLVVLHAATAHLGVAFVPVDPSAPTDQARRALRGVQVDHLVAGDEHCGAAQALEDLVPGVSALSVLCELPGTAAEPAPPLEHGEDVREGDFQAIFLTSGSTGDPKGVALSHRTQWIRSTSGALPEPRGVTVSMFPLFHMAGWIVALQCWQARAAVVFVERADAETILAAVERHEAQRLYAIPAVWQRIFAADPDGSRGSSLRVVDTGTSATPPELLGALTQRYPQARRRVFYGSTEAGPTLMLEGDELGDHPSTVGRAQPGVEVRAVAGELEVRGVHLFSGYVGNDGEIDPGLTEDGWYRTGDLAEQDEAGRWSIVGRVRQVIRTGGESVSPDEVESVLDAVRGVRESAVVGLPDPDWGEQIVAVVAPEDPDSDTESLRSALEAACAEALSKARRPRRYEFCAALPRTAATGQIRRALIAERLAAGLDVQEAGS